MAVTNTGEISSGNNAIDINTGAATIGNGGLISSYSDNGIYLGAGGTITNATSFSGNGFIVGRNDGIYAKNTFVAVTNYGSITGRTIMVLRCLVAERSPTCSGQTASTPAALAL